MNTAEALNRLHGRLDELSGELRLLHERLAEPVGLQWRGRPEFTHGQIQRQSDEAMRLYHQVMG